MQINYKKQLHSLISATMCTFYSSKSDGIPEVLCIVQGLRNMGKNANVLCSDEFPKIFFMYKNYTPQRFAPKTL